ncbi:DUF3866 family protein [Caldalkalibacillus mannanilyticus]|uniref:DUF3866 family protein n=1 Tax=Caldalkalibacillus mannanilyticus TaxID=1418 RepID=UPI000468C010|nr:DUF3866 family protein [Caldalkalibacillus mannanilyticus]
MNTSALDLRLGTGGYAFVTSIHAEPCSTDKKSIDTHSYPGHIMKLRYTPIQTPVLSVEAEESEEHWHFQSPFSLEGRNVFVGELHSMLPVLASLLLKGEPNKRLVYIMDDQAAMYLSFSQHVRELKKRINLITITYGQALGGDIEAINVYTALEAAVKVAKADHILITQGPGVIGTGTKRGFSGMQLVHWIHAIHSCQGKAIVIPRIQFADHRERHCGLSHHTFHPLAFHTFTPVSIPFPIQSMETGSPLIEEDQLLKTQFSRLIHLHHVIPISLHSFQRELEQALAWYEKPIRTMGRNYLEEPYFFYAIGAAYYFYKELV